MRKENVIAFSGLVVRFMMIWFGRLQDGYCDLHYTDIDYLVFSDAAVLVAAKQSPYERPTYRYTPIVAYLLLPNRVFGMKFGKILFSIFDFVTGQAIVSAVSPERRLVACLMWNVNPVTINISTRGNCDGLASLLIVCIIMSIEKRDFAIAAVLYGLAVHMRLFPIFFVFSLMLHLGWRTVPFGIISGATFMILNLLFFAIYGEDFLNETFLYHLVRADYRHNFSSPWLSVYLGKNPIQWWTVSRILMTLFLSFRFRKNLRFCWATIVMCFITFNPVCTVQYYDWVICLLALNSEFVLRRKFVFCLIVWGVCHGIWLQFAYLLEFCGYSVFVFTWIASVAVFFGNNVLLWGLISETDVSDESHPSILC